MSDNYDAEVMARRLRGIVSRELRRKTVLVVGLGAGSFAVELLARHQPREIIGYDPDVVTLENLSRTAYTRWDASRRTTKAEALAERLRTINPYTSYELIAQDITQLDEAEASRLFDRIDLVIAGTDRLAVQEWVNRRAHHHHVPAIFVGFHRYALGGRIVWTLPGEGPCYKCLDRRGSDHAHGAITDLHGEPASPVDTVFIDMVALRIALALLDRWESSAMSDHFKAIRGRHEVVVRTDPTYEWGATLWNAVLGDLPTEPRNYGEEIRDVLCSGDTLWLRGERDPDCTVCGSQKQ